MNKLTIDMETRSAVKLEDQGLYRYAEDKTTDIMCIAFKINKLKTHVWIPDKFLKLLPEHYDLPLVKTENFLSVVESSKIDIIEAHNVEFELALWASVMHNRYGHKDLPFEKLRCSAAKCAYFALPRALAKAGDAVDLITRKDPVGKGIMLKMCKPRKPTKKDPSKWNEDPEDFLKLCKYCIQDVEAEHELSDKLPDIPKQELESWKVATRINKRGIKVDIEGINNIVDKIADSENQLLLECQTITNGFIQSVRQRDNTLRWLEKRGVKLADFTKDTVIKTLKRKDLPSDVRRVLELRQILGKSSVAKFNKMKEYACSDNRMRGLFMWHGADTGRFSGKGPQLQNYPRDSYKDEQIDQILKLGIDSIDFLYDPMLKAASKCLRGMLIAKENHSLIAADFSQIELIVLAWLAQEEKVIQQYKDKKPVYELTAAEIYDVHYTKIDKEQRQIGKVFNLALGYQGWYGALLSMAHNYNIALPPEETCVQMMTKWRTSRPATVRFWYNLQDTALKVVETGKSMSVGRIKIGVQHGFLRIMLPSGRVISYYQPQVDTKLDQYGRAKKVVTHMAYRSKGKNSQPIWHRVHTYGGKLAENVTQAVAYDLLMEAIKRVEKAKHFPTVLHVHDEIVSEVDNRLLDKYGKEKVLKKFETTMAQNPAWAVGLPISTEGWIGKRYKK